MRKRLHNVFMSNRLRTASAVTMDDIAEELGLSKSTVSRALAGSGRISGETVRRVRECAGRLGFRPNVAARALAGKRTLNIAAVMPREAAGSRALFFHECLSGMAVRAEEDGYSVLVCFDALGEIVRDRRADAAVLTQVRAGDGSVELLRGAGIPFVVVGSLDGAVQVDSRMADECAEFTRKCLSRSAGAGGVVFVCGSLDVAANANRLSGFLAGMEDSDVPHAVCTDADDFEVDAGNPWRLVLCSDDVVCVRVTETLRRAGIRPGEETALAAFHDSVILEAMGVSALRVDAAALGAKAVDVAVRMLSGEDFDRASYVGSTFRWRGSTGGGRGAEFPKKSFDDS